MIAVVIVWVVLKGTPSWKQTRWKPPRPFALLTLDPVPANHFRPYLFDNSPSPIEVPAPITIEHKSTTQG